MDTTLIKFLILWIICENIVSTTSMALNGVPTEDANTRQKRSPANNFSLFGLNLGNPVETARKSLNTFGNIFSSNRGNPNNNHEPTKPYGNVRSTNTFSPTDIPNRYGFQSTTVQNDLQGDRYIWPQEDKTEFNKKNVPDKKQTSTDKYNTKPPVTEPQQEYETPENTAYNPSNVDAELINYIFQNSQVYYDSTSTTVDNNIDFVTETGEYDSSTDLGNRIAPAVVASLLG